MASGVAIVGIKAQPADLDTIADFAAAIAGQVTNVELENVAKDLEAKSLRISGLFGELENYTDARLGALILGETFLSRRKRREISATVPDGVLCDALLVLGDVSRDPFSRLAPLIALVAPLGEGATDVAYELLHFLEPERFCLATSWVWNPVTETGSLKLLLDEEYDLFGDSDLDGFSRVNFAVDYLGETIDAAGLLMGQNKRFAMDVFLAGVYGIYMSTVLEMRMTKEFNKILPPLLQLTRRLLGVYQKEGK